MTFTEVAFTWNWTGAPSPNVSKFQFAGSATPASASSLLVRVKAFMDGLTAYLPAAVSLVPQGIYQTFDEGISTPAGGAQLIDQGTAATIPQTTQGTGTGVWSAATGAWINWITTAFVNGRRVVGRTYLVPLGNTNVFQTDGTLSDTFRNAVVANGNSLNNGSPAHVVYYNRGGPSDPPRPTDKPHAFGWQSVTACTVPDKAGILRSRRD
jgi:hypothetical protein